MKKTKILFVVLTALLAAEYADAQVSLKIKLSSPEHGDTVLIYDFPDSNLHTVNNVSFRMIPVQGGTFFMGCTGEQVDYCGENEKPVHIVTLSDYSIGETEVTQELWMAVMGNNNNPSGSRSNGVTCPVEQVTWDAVVGTSGSAVAYTINGVTYYQNGFCYKLSQLVGGGKQFRLPTEAEWEYAARDGNEGPASTEYSGSNNIDLVAWYSENTSDHDAMSDRGQKVKRKRPNYLGLYDMSGNVGEWCSDWLGEYGSDAQTNPTGPAAATDEEHGDRVVRGGSWDDSAEGCRVSFRSSFLHYWYNDRIGFRLAL